jgi:anti-sigma B factor antagonist
MADQVHPLSIDVAPGEDAQAVVVHGEVDLATAPDLQSYIDSVIQSTDGDVLVDLADVGYLDSTGLAMLLTAHDRLAATGRSLRVRDPSIQVVRLLEICGACHLIAPDGDGLDGLNQRRSRAPAAESQAATLEAL